MPEDKTQSRLQSDRQTGQRQVRRRGQFVYAGEAPPGKPKQPIPWRKFFWRAGVFVLAAGIVWTLFVSGWFSIKGFEIKGNTTIAKASIEKAANQYLQEHPLQRNIFFLQSKSLALAIRQAEPTLQDAQASRNVFLKVNILVKESQPAIIWQTGDQTWLIAEDGRVLRRTESSEGGLGKIIDTAQLKVEAGDKVVDRQFVSFAREFFTAAQNQGLQIESGSIGATTRELNIRLKNGIVIKTDTSRSAQTQLQAYLDTIATAKKQNKQPTEYVDVRITGRTFYK